MSTLGPNLHNSATDQLHVAAALVHEIPRQRNEVFDTVADFTVTSPLDHVEQFKSTARVYYLSIWTNLATSRQTMAKRPGRTRDA